MRGWIGTVLATGVFAAVQIAVAEGSQSPSGEMRIEREVEAACREIDEGQAALSDRCSLADYRALVRAVNGTNMWTAALQKALDEHEIVTIPASDEKYFFDGTVVVPSRRRIEAKGATIRLADGMRTVLLRNASAQDGTLAPIPASSRRDTDIAIVGGRWEDCCTRRAGYGRTGMFNLLPRRKGNYFGVSTLFFFNNVNRLSVTGATFHRTGGFAVQAGDGDAVAFRDISFDRCFADGLHLNGNLTRVLARNVRGQVGDDLVALNAYDWLNSSVNFGPQRYILCEDLELVRLPGVPAYPAIRIQPAKYRYADGSVVDCAISDVIFRRVKGITTYKMYLQTPRYTIGSTPEWAEVGSGGNLFFSDLEIDLDAPIDKIGQYATQEAPRGHFAAFEFGANLSLVHFKNIDITFHADKWPLTHLVQVGPKSCFYPGKDGKPGTEIFDPYVSCRVKRVVLENVRVHGTPPAELVYSAAFDDINKDGRSTGRGVIEKIVEARGTRDVARVKGTDGVWREVPLVGVREADGGVRYTFPAAEARKAQIVQFWLDRAQAKTGEEGFWVGGRGVVGHFTRPKMRWVNGAQFMDHPYFAMQTPRGAFIAIVEGMRFEFNAVVEAKDGRYRAYPSWDIEHHALGEVYEDLSLVVYDLGKGADWNAMAKAYRRRVLAREGATRRIETLKERAKARPHLLKMANAVALRRRHACKPYVFKDPKHDIDFTPETEKKPQCLYSFAQTLAFLHRLKALGVDDVAFCVAGWQDGGYDGRCPSSFPVSPEAGGEAELRKLIRGGQTLGYIVDGHSNYTDCYAVSPMWDNGNIACKFPDGSIQRCHDAFAGGRAYRLCLKNAWETFLPGELAKIADLGFRGAHYIDVFTAVYPYACCDPRHRANRKEIAAYQRQVVERCIKLFGGFSSECDMDHLIGLVDYVNYNTREIKNAQNARAKGRNPPFDRIVPFSELAFHDYLLANPDKSTQEFPSGQNWLDLVEFGGRPIVYNFTDGDAEKIRDLYLKFKPLRHLQLEEMVEHRDVAPGVLRVTYGDGSRVYVNHTDALVEVDGVRVPARDYFLLRAAEDASAVVARREAVEAARGAGKRGWIAWEAERNQYFPTQNLVRVKAIASFLSPTAMPAGAPARHRAEWDARTRTDEGKRRIAAAEKVLAAPLVRVPPESFDEYRKTGNRGVYAGPKGKAEANLCALVYGEALENKGRFLGKISDYILAVCAEPSWVAPFEGGCADRDRPLHGDHYIDLTASRTAACIATATGWFRDRLPPATVARALDVLRARIFNTFLKDSRRTGGTAPYLNWWMPDRFNWSAVCHNGCVTAILAVEDDPFVRAEAIESAERLMVPCFLSGFGADGFCEEGMGYWNFGFGNFMNLAGQIRAATDGRVDFCAAFPRAKVVAGFGARYRMDRRSSPPFADGNGAPASGLLALINQAWPDLYADEVGAVSPFTGECWTDGFRSFGKFKLQPRVAAKAQPLPCRDWFADAGVLIARHGRLSLAVKGGSNGDRHNHDDAGSYVINVDSRELAGDPGNEEYTGRTFSKRRYESKVLNSYGHPVPRVGGELQGTGPAFGAKVLRTDFTPDRDMIVYDLAGAYPAKVPSVKLERTVVFDRKANEITVSDEVEFAEPTAFESPVIAWEKPRMNADRNRFSLVRKGVDESLDVAVDVRGGEWDMREEFIENPRRVQPYRLAVAFREPILKGLIAFRYRLDVRQ